MYATLDALKYTSMNATTVSFYTSMNATTVSFYTAKYLSTAVSLQC